MGSSHLSAIQVCHTDMKTFLLTALIILAIDFSSGVSAEENKAELQASYNANVEPKGFNLDSEVAANRMIREAGKNVENKSKSKKAAKKKLKGTKKRKGKNGKKVNKGKSTKKSNKI